jgi:glutaredoxin 2
MFEHCSLCFRVRMAAALKRVHLQETVVLDMTPTKWWDWSGSV